MDDELLLEHDVDTIVKQLPDELEVQLDNEDEDDILIQLGELDWEKHVLEEELEQEDVDFHEEVDDGELGSEDDDDNDDEVVDI